MSHRMKHVWVWACLLGLLMLLSTSLALAQDPVEEGRTYLPWISSSGPDQGQLVVDECQSELYKRLRQISIHANDPEVEKHQALISRCAAEELKAYQASNQAIARADRIIAPVEGLINFENPHVHPIDLTPDGNTLVAVNIAAHMLEVYQVSGSNLTHLSSIPVGLDPVSVRARSNNEVWVVNHVSDSVSIVDLNLGAVIKTLNTDNEPADVVFAGSPLRAFVTASEANAVNVFDLNNLNAAPQRVNIFGEDPRALAVSSDGSTVYAAIFESGNNTTVQGGGSSATIVRNNSLADNDVAIINANNLNVQFQSGLMTMVMSLAINPANNNITVIGTESLNDILLEPNLNGIFSRVNLATFPQGGSPQIVDLNPHLDYASPTVAQSIRNQSIGDPRGIAWRNNGNEAFITGMGSNNIVVVNGQGNRLDRIEVGQGPTGIVLKDNAGLGFVMNKFSGSISVINLDTRQQVNEITFDDPTPQVIKDGRPLLYDTHRTSGLGHVSCASCHIDARTDRLAWDLGDPNGASVAIPEVSNFLPGGLTGNTVNVPATKGPMVTQSLQDIMEHPRLHWRGDRENLAAFNPAFQLLLGDDIQLTTAEMTAFGDFLATIWLQPNPYRNLDDTRPRSVTLPDGRTVTTNSTLDALRGNNPTNNNCLACHSGQGNATRNFGANAEIGSNIIAPALPGIYDKLGFGQGLAGFGFFHTGEADIDRAARLSTSENNDDFLAELMTLGGPSGPLTGGEIRQVPHAGVGQQLTINGSPTSAQNSLLNQFKSISTSSPFVVLIAKAKLNGIQRGFVYLGNDNFQSDRQTEQMALAQLLTAAANGEPVTFMLVANGTETRIALDANNNGIFNGDEALIINNPGNQTSVLGSIVSLQLTAFDPDGNSINYSVSALPPGLSLNANTGVIAGIPTSAGQFSVMVTVTNSNNDVATTSFNWQVTVPVGDLYFDDFEADTGWITNPLGTDSATTGQWERANPEETSSQAVVMQLGNTISGLNALVTEGTAGASVGSNDIDNGATSIRSPNITLPSATPIELSFSYYLAHLDNATAADFLQVQIIGNTTVTVLEEVGSADNDAAIWAQANINLDNFAGQDIRILVVASDADSGSLIEAGIDDLRITAPLNQPPVVTDINNRTNTVGDTVSLTIQATDVDNDPLTFSAIGLPAGLSITANSGQISGNPTTVGVSNVTISVSDGQESGSVSFVWTIEDVPNTPPTITNPGDQTNTVGDNVSLSVQALDADGDPLIFSANGLPNGLSINSGLGEISGNPTIAGSFNVTLSVSDGVDSVSAGFVWVIEEPVVTCGPLFQEGEAATLSGAFTTVSDSAASGGQYIGVPDRFGNGSVGGPNRAEFCFNVTTAGTYKLLGSVWAPDGGSNSFYVTINGQPAAGYKWSIPTNNATFFSDYVNDSSADVEVTLPAGQNTVEIYLREDGTGIDTLALELIGTGGNQPPALVNPGTQNSQLGSTVNLPLLASDPDNDVLTFTATGLPAGLNIDGNNGLISGTPTTLGTSNVTVSVSDGNGGSDSISFSWAINDEPTACGPLFQEAESALLNGLFTTVSDGSASEGQYIEVPDLSGNGSVGGPNRAEFCFEVSTAGTYKLQGAVWAENGGSNSFYVTIDGQPVAGHKWTMAPNTTFTNDYANHNGVDIEVTLAAGPHTVVVYLREDGTKLDTLALVLVGAGGNQAPTLVNPGNRTSLINNPVSLNLTATDPENDTLTFSAINLPVGLTLNSNTGAIAGTPTTVDTYNVTITVDDGNGNSDNVNFDWIINDETTVSCGPMSQEAEDALLSGFFTTVDDSSASGGQYIEVPSGIGTGDVGGPNRAEFCFDVPANGTYKLLASVWAPSSSSNSFYVTVDGLPAAGYKWNIPTNAVFSSDYVSNNGVDVELTLAAGEHTVVVYLREAGTKLDTLMLE